MKSLKAKTTLLSITIIIVVIVVATIFSVMAVRDIGNRSADQLLYSLCESGEKDLDHYFESIEKSVEILSTYIEADLDEIEVLDDEELLDHVNHVRELFAQTAQNTNGVLTYYYRIDPSVSNTEEGFWYVNLDGEGFVEHKPTNIRDYDLNDTTKLVWYTVPRMEGEAIWLPPYMTDNLNVYVLSYNSPIYRHDKFVGVVGIEIDYSTMALEVNKIQLFNNGYAFINNETGKIVYHPRIDVVSMPDELEPTVPDGLLSSSSIVNYTFEGVERRAVWKTLENGMRLNVSVPIAEINETWLTLIYEMVGVAILLLIIFIYMTIKLTSHITKPLEDLTNVARQVNEGDYNFVLDYHGDDEVGVLTEAFSQLISNLRIYISDLSNLAYTDALTSVHNKGAFDIKIKNIQEAINEGKELEFAICIFDCNELKEINDTYGHDKGDLYLKNTCRTICHTFRHSPVYRLGGDEFGAILQNVDYKNRDKLIKRFDKTCKETIEDLNEPWEKVDVARGMAIYDPIKDLFANDVARRADKLMYEDKRKYKAALDAQNENK